MEFVIDQYIKQKHSECEILSDDWALWEVFLIINIVVWVIIIVCIAVITKLRYQKRANKPQPLEKQGLANKQTLNTEELILEDVK